MGYEILKLFAKRILIVFIPVLILLNGYLFYQDQLRNHGYLMDHLDEYSHLEEQYKHVPVQQSLDEIVRFRDELTVFSTLLHAVNFSDDPLLQDQLEDIRTNRPEHIENFNQSKYVSRADLISRDMQLSGYILSQLRAITDYQTYVQGIQNRADELLRVSIFHQEGTFSYRNILKTPGDFEDLIDIPLEIGLDIGVVSSSQFRTTDILFVITLFILCTYLFLHEKEQGLHHLLRSNRHGRFPTVLAKLMVLSALTAVMVFLYYGTLFWISNQLYGFGDMSRSIQSMSAFKYSHLQLNVGEWIIAFLISKLAVCLLVAALFSMVFVLFYHASKIYVYISLLLGVSFLAFHFIHPMSYINVLKYINIIAFLDTFRLLGEYKNVNLFGFPVNSLWLSAVCIVTFIIFFMMMSIWIHTKQRTIHSNPWWTSWWIAMRGRLFRGTRSTQIFTHELYKALFTGKGYIIVAIAVYLSVQLIQWDEVRFNEEEAYYNSYIREVAGQLNEDKVDYIENEMVAFNRLPQEHELNEIAYRNDEITITEYYERQNELHLFAARSEAFQKVYQQYNHLLWLQETSGIQGSFINEITTDYLFSNQLRDLIHSLLYSALLILFLSALFPLDERNGMNRILRCTQKGRLHLFSTKYIIGWIFATVLMVLIYFPQYYNVHQHYFMQNWSAPIQSIQSFDQVDMTMSILGFVVLTNIMQGLGILVMVLCALCTSIWVRKQSLTVIINVAWMAVPILIQLTGVEFLQKITLNRVFLLFTEFADGVLIAEIVFYFSILIALGMMSVVLAWKYYNGNTGLRGEFVNLSIQNISKTYQKGKIVALSEFTAQFTPGVYGILGPNGAGKSTLMNIITDNLKPDTGIVKFNEHSIVKMGKDYRSILGYMPQQQSIYDDFTAHRFLWYMAALKGLKKQEARDKIDQLLTVVNLKEDAHKKLGSYSGGMKQRILIAQALLNDPQILILDEPTAGLDPRERIRIRNFISTIAINKIVILATHVVSDIEYIAKEVLVMKEGSLILKNTPIHLLEDIKDKVFEVRATEDEIITLQNEYKISNITMDKDGLNVRIVHDDIPVNMHASPTKPTLEDLYLYMFGL